MPNEPDWRPAAWLYGGGFTVLFALRWIFRSMLTTPAGRLKFASGLFAAAVYGVVVYALVFAPEAPADIARHFGASPGGIPVRVLIWLVVTVLYLPLLFGAWHFMLLTMAANELGYFGKFGLIRFYFRAADFPELRRSARIVGCCAAYGILLLIALGCLGTLWHDH
jgi:hypothetical protein